jgi:hypothetical protein
MKKIYIILLFSFIIIDANQLKIAYDKELTILYPQLIKNPEICQSFYGELTGSADYYKIITDEPFDLCISIMAPDIEDARDDFSIAIYGDNNKRITLYGDRYEWVTYYERSTEYRYWKGPSYEETVEPGEYLIQVYNDGNEGKYVLVIGERPTFFLFETINYVINMPKLTGFFEKPVIATYFNRIGIFLFVALLVLVVIIAFSVALIQRLSMPKHRPL